ncbi:MAG: O-antigen ligase family protein [Bacilli bacterium]|nr:O-antigen ligase family protein [Bacilli bacterium]
MIPCINLISLIFLFYKKYNKQLLAATSIFLIVAIIINFVTILLFPDGLYIGNNTNEHYFLGQRNDLIEYILPCLLCFSIYNFKYKTSKLIFCIFNLICMFSVILTWSANAMTALTIYYVYLFFFYIKKKDNVFSPLNIYLISFFTSYSIIILKIQNLFSWIIEGILHKNLTFTGRTSIWDKSIAYIKKSFLYGYGKESEIIKFYKIGHSNSCHNYFLDFLYDGGILMFIIILFIIITLNKSYKNKCVDDKAKTIVSSIFIGYFIIGIATPIHLNTICYLFYSLYMLKYFLEEKVQNEK